MNKILIIMALLFSSRLYSSNLPYHYIDGYIDYVGSFDDSIVIEKSTEIGFQKRTMIQGWVFKKRKIKPKKGMEINWTLKNGENRFIFSMDKKI